MATCDPDGTIGRRLNDRLVCLGMELSEWSSTAVPAIERFAEAMQTWEKDGISAAERHANWSAEDR